LTYRISQISVSKLETFDACERKWFFNWPMGLNPPSGPSAINGEKGHELIATYLKTGKPPEGRVKMGTAVTRAIEKGLFPKPGPDLIVERRFSGQPKYHPTEKNADGSPKWLWLDKTKAPIWSHGIPWDGFIDLMYARDEHVTTEDHKFGASIEETGKKSEDLINTVQMPIYALVGLHWFPDAETFRITHNQIAFSGPYTAKPTAIVTKQRVLERKGEIDLSVARMIQAATAASAEDVPATVGDACTSYGGCAHQSICSAFKKKFTGGSTKMANLTAEELALFGEAPAAPVAEPPPPVALIPDSLAAVIPPDAPANDPGLKPPAKRGRPPKPKSILVDVAPGETEAAAVARASAVCDVCGDPSPKPDHAETCPLRRVNPLSLPIPPAVHKPELPPRKINVQSAVDVVIADLEPGQIVAMPNPYGRLARALRAAADALEQP
jgi:hypothetical protein